MYQSTKARVAALVVVSVLIFSALACGSSGTKTSGTVESQTSVSPTPRPTMVPYAEVAEKQPGMTEVQWDNWKKELEGSWIEGWEGIVSNVDKEMLGKRYVLYVDLDYGEIASYDVALYIPEADAAKYNKDQTVQFSGVVDDIMVVLAPVIYVDEAQVQIK